MTIIEQVIAGIGIGLTIALFRIVYKLYKRGEL